MVEKHPRELSIYLCTYVSIYVCVRLSVNALPSRSNSLDSPYGATPNYYS